MHRALVLSVVSFVLFAFLAPAAHAHGLILSSPEGVPSRPGGESPIALTLHRVQAKIDGPVADVALEQTFRNRTDRQLEGTYLFPLPEGAAVSDFAMTMGGRMVKGEVLEAAQARAIYEGIVRRRRDPGLLEYVGRGLFRARVFPIPPQGDVTIALSFQQVLPDSDGTLEFRYPLATDRLHGEPVGETVVTVDVTSDVDLKAVYSPSHEVAVVRKGDREVHASYERSKARQPRDFLLHVGRSEDRVGLTLLSHKGAGADGTFLAVLAPRMDRGDLPVVPKDVVFVLDVSGSMNESGKIQQAKRALRYGINVLRPGDRFNILAFSTGVRPFRDGLVKADPAVKIAAGVFIGSLTAGGGTNIAQALEQGLGLGASDRLCHVVFLTDGRPTVGERRADALVKSVERWNKSKARVFTFGVGFDLDVGLLDKIAGSTNGARDYVMPEEELEIATSRFFRKVVEPSLTDVEIDLGGGVHDVYPKRVPDLFAGGQVVLMGRYPEPGKRTVRLKGRHGSRVVEYVFEASLAGEERADYLPRLWAHRKVAFLLDEIRLNGEEQELVAEVVRLGTRHAIVTPYTSGLVVEDAELEGMRSANPLFVSPRTPPAPGRSTGGHGGAYRGPGASVPPGLREPSDPTPAPPPPPSGPPSTPTPITPSSPLPAKAPEHSKRLAEEKQRASRTDGLAVKLVAGRTFKKDADGRWVDTLFDGEKETKKIEAYSKAWSELLAKGGKFAKYLGLGERVVFVDGDVIYEIVPAPEEKPTEGE